MTISMHMKMRQLYYLSIIITSPTVVFIYPSALLIVSLIPDSRWLSIRRTSADSGILYEVRICRGVPSGWLSRLAYVIIIYEARLLLQSFQEILKTRLQGKTRMSRIYTSVLYLADNFNFFFDNLFVNDHRNKQLTFSLIISKKGKEKKNSKNGHCW